MKKSTMIEIGADNVSRHLKQWPTGANPRLCANETLKVIGFEHQRRVANVLYHFHRRADPAHRVACKNHIDAAKPNRDHVDSKKSTIYFCDTMGLFTS